MQMTHTNKIKRFHNIHYCFTCGYDIDHPRNTFPVSDPSYHMSNIPRDDVHMYNNQGEIIVQQHKSLPDGTGSGMGYIIVNIISKAQFVMKRYQ